MDCQSKFDSNLAGIRNEPSKLKKDSDKLGSELAVSKHVNGILQKRMINMERQCWSNNQYSRRECRDVTGIPDSTESIDLEQTILKVFEKLEVMVDTANVEDCHWIKTSNGSKKMIIKLSQRKDAAKIRSSKKKLKEMDFSSLGIKSKVYMNVSQCNITNYFGENVKACSQTNVFTPFGLLMVLCS